MHYATKAMLIVAQANARGMQYCVSERGLAVAYRARCYECKDQAGPEYDSLFLGGSASVVNGYWVWQRHFSLEEVADQTRPLPQALKRFASEMRDGAWAGVDYSLKTTAHGRDLGATASGKVCSGRNWYLCFARDESGWKLARMEIIDH